VSTPIAYFLNWIIQRSLAAPRPPRQASLAPRDPQEQPGKTSAEFDAACAMSRVLEDMQLHRQSLGAAERAEFDG